MEDHGREELAESISAGVVSSAKFSDLTTPSGPSLRSAHPPLLCEEGNTLPPGIANSISH